MDNLKEKLSKREEKGEKGEHTSDCKENGGGRRESSLLQSDLKNAVSQTWVAPDGGWGWVVVLSALVISIIVDGLTYTFGLFFGEFEAEFKEPKSTVSLAGSLQVGVYLMAGPFVSALTNRFGCRIVIIAGSLVTGSAFVVSSFSPNISMLIATYGFIGGLGFGMMYLPAIVAVSVYFEKRRAFATGIAVCGSGIGTFVLAPLTKVLLNEYNWSWTLIIMAGLILNGVACGGVMRPLEPVTRSVSPCVRSDSIGGLEDGRQRKLSFLTDPGASIHDGSPASARKARLRTRSSSTSNNNGLPAKPETIPLITVTDEKEETTIVLAQKKQQQQQQQQQSTKQVVVPKATPVSLDPQNNDHHDNGQQQAMLFSSVPNIARRPSGSVLKKAPRASVPHSSSVMDVGSAWQGQEMLVPKPPKETIPLGLSFIGLSDAHINKIRDDVSLRLSRRDISKSVTLIAQDFAAIAQDGYITSIRSINSLESRDGDIGGGLWQSLKETLEEMLDLSILKDKRYWFVLLGNFFCMIGFYVPFVYIPERAQELGLSEERAAFLISVIGIANIVGRLATGVVVNFLKIDSLLLTSLALALCGVVTAICPLCESYEALICVSTFFGLGVAAYISLCSILLCELLGVKNLTNAFGFVILFRGVASTIGPPIAGALIDATGVFHPAFYLAGGMIVLAAACHALLLLPCIKNLQAPIDL